MQIRDMFLSFSGSDPKLTIIFNLAILLTAVKAALNNPFFKRVLPCSNLS